MIGQCIYVFFRRGHFKLRNRPTILVSLESTGPYQRNGASLVFMRCVVLEIQLFLIHVLQKFSFLQLGPYEDGKTISNSAEILPRVASEREQEAASKNTLF